MVGTIRQGPSFTMTSDLPGRTAQTANNPYADYTNPYGGVDPGTISAQPFLDYMSQVSNLALDPQQQLQDREAQRLQEATRAGLEARGLNTSGVGAGIEGDVMSDFGIDWQNNLLNRATQGGQTMFSLGGLSQGIANTGFDNAGKLGASAFEYDPMASGGGAAGAGGSFSYNPGAYAPPSAPNFTPWSGQRQQQQQQYIPQNTGPSRYQQAASQMFSPGGSRYRSI